jgi:di/tricarboxylate transporter
VEESRPVRHDRATISVLLLALLVVMMTMSTTGSQFMQWPLVLIAFLIAGLMVATRCLSATSARQSVDYQVLLTIVAAIGLGKALENSGAARVIAHTIVAPIRDWGPTAALATVYLVTQATATMVGNKTAAVLMFPVALPVAADLGVDPRPFALTVALAASASFASPISYQTNLMVYGPGRYRFADFVRVGLPLVLILCAVATLIIPRIWHF